VCRLKGGWLLQASRPEKCLNAQQNWAFAKPCKEKKMPPRDMVSVKLGGIGTESAGNRTFMWVAGMREGRILPKV